MAPEFLRYCWANEIASLRPIPADAPAIAMVLLAKLIIGVSSRNIAYCRGLHQQSICFFVDNSLDGC
ncbi:MAG: hypothetical protein RMY30_038155 [Nostoc sp. CmiSLP01]|nr:hypothetical protein [Nostoc sp. CmiSLP01]MDZ8289088.1 hypothetical protein [Nostoc sp. ChiSLP01]